ncbi:hypothetical protein GCM10009557_62210 [Virgisporangium ochraceum]|uniref:DsrE family protein n=1 Tax=Virgisporangium ochraceum TaxID=65505 RepID=A0A8J4EGL8_9ACTN|nr:DsrE family protein [Virgisporangium ochraceum]GIJ73828.1 hypothetical protein Voc01_087450 [Virgisporangium ochraceum]
MATAYVMVETAGPWRGPGCARFVSDAVTLCRAGHPVQLVLLQDGVTAALPGAVPGLGDGVEVWVDEFSLSQRGLPVEKLAPATRVVTMTEIALRILDPATRVVWH